MNNVKEYVAQIQAIADRIPLGKREVCKELGLGATMWYRLRTTDSNCHAKTIRAMKAFIEKYKDVL